ncbi:WhiB family transcriptional regulator [Streptomyces sp. NPDC060194]|uniref:WhiB family transcriptional regulator n=1 Tax=Streptomyces sp. NPDC060194 TaxID=3347069 RepID=UPI003666BFC3
MREAACLHEDPELFFPVGQSGPGLSDQQRALAVCAGCPVRAACLEWALEIGRPTGVWGGTTEDDREKLRRRRHAHAG